MSKAQPEEAKFPWTVADRGGVRKGEVALLVIDMQQFCAVPGKGIFSHIDPHNIPEEWKYYFERLESTTIPAIQTLLEAFRTQRQKNNADIIYTCIESLTKDGRDICSGYKTLGLIVPKGHPDAQVIASIAPQDDEIYIPKAASSVFNGTNIDFVLRNLGVTQIVIVGITTEQCVESAVRDAFDKGYHVLLPEEACATKTEDTHQSTIENAKLGLASCVSVAEIVEQMSSW